MNKVKEIILSQCWHPNNAEIYFTKHSNGIWKVNYLTGVVSHVKPSCQTKNYNYISISPDGTKLVAERINGPLLSSTKVFFSSRIYLIDLSTGKETQLTF
jgi:Tol biopolymer transport system component